MKRTAVGHRARIRRIAGEPGRAHAVCLVPDAREGRRERRRVRMPRAVEDVLSRALLNNPARVHHRRSLADVRERREVVRDEDQREAELSLQALEELQDLRLHHDVERRGGLVGDQDLGIAGERKRDEHTLALATRELVRVVGGAATGQADDRRLQEIPGTVPSMREAIAGCAFAPRCRLATDQCHREAPPLELKRPGHAAACWHSAALEAAYG